MHKNQKEKIFSKTTLNVSEKIRNEIIPLLDGTDEDIDELDDEVAMISNKKGNDKQTYKQSKAQDEISADDIKIEFKT